MPYDASPYTKEELEALRHPPTKCVNLSDDARWLATIDSISSRCEEAVALLKTARIECEPLCPNGVSKTRQCECSRGRVAAFLDTNADPHAPESKVEKARREFCDATVEAARRNGVFKRVALGKPGDDIERVMTWGSASDALQSAGRLVEEKRLAMLAAERDAGRGT